MMIRLLLILLMLATGGATRAASPNIVFILVDDLGWADLQCYGHPYHRTPNIDQLATDGLRLTNAYSPAPICSASRASVLTGKSVPRLGFEFVTKNEPGHQQVDADVPLATPELTLDLPLSERTIAERLAERDYETAFFGKWHVSRHFQGRYLAWHPDFGPAKQGFSVSIEDFGDHPYAWGKSTKPKDLPIGQMPADSMFERTAEFIRQRRHTDGPYFVMASTFYVHTPVKNRCRWLVRQHETDLPTDATNRKKRLEYAAFVETLDHHVGAILNAIDDSGQRDNTLVLLMSDNGGHPEFCSNAPLRGSKWNLYEGGIRVPMIARWPARITAGSVSHTPVIGYDLLPTFIQLTGGDADGVDGVALGRLFSDPQWQMDRSLLWHFPYYHPEKGFADAIEGIGIDDFAVSRTRPQSAIRRGKYKLIELTESGDIELYDLSADIGEQVDLSQQEPSVAESLQRELHRRLRTANARRATPKNE